MARNAIKPIENKHVRPMAQVSTERVRIPEVPIPCEPVIYLRESSTFFTPWFTYAEWSLRFMQHMPSEFLQLCSWANSRKSMAARLHRVACQTEPHQWASLLRVLMLLFFFFFFHTHTHTHWPQDTTSDVGATEGPDIHQYLGALSQQVWGIPWWVQLKLEWCCFRVHLKLLTPERSRTAKNER